MCICIQLGFQKRGRGVLLKVVCGLETTDDIRFPSCAPAEVTGNIVSMVMVMMVVVVMVLVMV